MARGYTLNKLIDRIITVDESWMYHYDPELKQQRYWWKTATLPAPKTVKRSRSAEKIMIIIFFDSENFLYQHAVTLGSAVTADYYISV